MVGRSETDLFLSFYGENGYQTYREAKIIKPMFIDQNNCIKCLHPPHPKFNTIYSIEIILCDIYYVPSAFFV